MPIRLSCVFFAAAALAFSALDENKLVDLTHEYDDKTVYWPNGKPFEYHKEVWAKTPAGYWYASGSFSTSEHLGTHIDSPIHFGEGKPTTDKIPLKQLTGPAVVIDIKEHCSGDRDYALRTMDLAVWERAHGRIPPGAIVLVRTGWSRFWDDHGRYMGTTAEHDTANLHFPGIAAEAAKTLTTRGIKGVAIDTASLDNGPSKNFETHQILNGAGLYGLENVANLDLLPATGATLIALPMKIRNGTGGPVRIIAILP